MRQIFSSQRVETAEGVATRLREQGIEVQVTNGHSYRSRRSGQFSYAEPAAANQQPAEWVRLPEDQPRARELLREAGLLATSRPSRSNTWPRASPREPCALGLSIEYSSQSSARKLRWNHSAWSSEAICTFGW